MSLKPSSLQRLQRLVEDTSMKGFSGASYTGPETVEAVRTRLEAWFQEGRDIRGLLKDLAALAATYEQTQECAEVLRETAGQMGTAMELPEQLEFALDKFSKALGGSGIRYFR